MNRKQLLEQLFDNTWQPTQLAENFFLGSGEVGSESGDETIQVIGTAGAAEVGVDLALAMAGAVLDTVRQHPGRTLLFLLDTQGQRLRRRDELLGLNGYMAHLAKCVEIARSRGHRILSLVYGQAVSGGYLTTGMMADACYALADAEIKVMNLPAMARITKIPLERLETLARQSPVFSPGVANYQRMGHLLDVWQGDLAGCLHTALQRPLEDDRRLALGRERGGRLCAEAVADQVRAHA